MRSGRTARRLAETDPEPAGQAECGKPRPMLTALLTALDAAEADRGCRALLLTGEGRGFCAGQELVLPVMPGADGPPDLAQGGRPAPSGCAAPAGPALACGVRGERRGGRCRREHRAGLRHRAGGAQSRGSSRPSRRSAWCRISAAASSFRGWSARPVRGLWRCWASRWMRPTGRGLGHDLEGRR